MVTLIYISIILSGIQNLVITFGDLNFPFRITCLYPLLIFLLGYLYFFGLYNSLN